MEKLLALYFLVVLVYFSAESSTATIQEREKRSSDNFWGVKPKDCADEQAANSVSENGVRTIFVGPQMKPIEVYCDFETEGGGWLVFQRREDGYEDFRRGWSDYAKGFGDLYGEFWLGNHFLHLITQQKEYTLRVDLADFANNTRYAEYSNMTVAAPFQKYRLQLGTYRGDAGNALATHSGQAFSTPDADNDSAAHHCAVSYKGGWWYSACHSANLNGLYHGGNHTTYADGVNWKQWLGYHYSLKTTEMKLRPADFQTNN